jgi:hypothetical protein
LRHLQPDPAAIKAAAKGGDTKSAGLSIQHSDGSIA